MSKNLDQKCNSKKKNLIQTMFKEFKPKLPIQEKNLHSNEFMEFKLKLELQEKKTPTVDARRQFQKKKLQATTFNEMRQKIQPPMQNSTIFSLPHDAHSSPFPQDYNSCKTQEILSNRSHFHQNQIQYPDNVTSCKRGAYYSDASCQNQHPGVQYSQETNINKPRRFEISNNFHLNQNQQRSSLSPLLCKYGIQCTIPHCQFKHPQRILKESRLRLNAQVFRPEVHNVRPNIPVQYIDVVPRGYVFSIA